MPFSRWGEVTKKVSLCSQFNEPPSLFCKKQKPTFAYSRGQTLFPPHLWHRFQSHSRGSNALIIARRRHQLTRSSCWGRSWLKVLTSFSLLILMREWTPESSRTLQPRGCAAAQEVERTANIFKAAATFLPCCMFPSCRYLLSFDSVCGCVKLQPSCAALVQRLFFGTRLFTPVACVTAIETKIFKPGVVNRTTSEGKVPSQPWVSSWKSSNSQRFSSASKIEATRSRGGLSLVVLAAAEIPSEDKLVPDKQPHYKKKKKSTYKSTCKSEGSLQFTILSWFKFVINTSWGFTSSHLWPFYLLNTSPLIKY